MAVLQYVRLPRGVCIAALLGAECIVMVGQPVLLLQSPGKCVFMVLLLLCR
jgi:hypothetical protein